ncbi:MAG: cysteine-rich small domain-containing protein [Anaerovoracaceae bacterium]
MEGYKFFRNDKCEFFPCHDVNDKEKFNCLFCYCPLYVFDDKCGGRFVYTENGIKDCSLCRLPHDENSYEYIISKLGELSELKVKK